jgi:predicted metal-dependent phosphoesterase TrpH
MTIDCLMHVHSSFSYDSRTDLADIALRARREGYRCVLMSEHNNTLDQSRVDALTARCAELSDGNLLIIPGLELAFDNNCVHLLAYGIRRYIGSVGEACTFKSLVDQIHEQGGLAVLAHPSHKDACSRVDAADLERVDGIEIWNVKNGNRFCPDAGELQALRRLRRANRQLWGFGGLDLHHLVRFTRLATRVEVEHVSERAILDALRQGRFTTVGPSVAIGPEGEISALRVWLFGVGSRALKRARVSAYRLQARLEKRGFKTPPLIAAVARKLF